MFPKRPSNPSLRRGNRALRRILYVSLMVLCLVGVLVLGPVRPPNAAASQVVVGDPWFSSGGAMRLDHVGIQVLSSGGVATTSLSFRFTNVLDVEREAVLDIPLPSGATLTGFFLQVDNETWRGRVEERAAARQAYEDAKERGEDAVLLEQADDDGVRLAIQVPANATRTLTVRYVEALGLESGARAYRFPLSALWKHPTTLHALDVEVNVTSNWGIQQVNFPGMPLAIDRSHPQGFTASYSGENVAPMEDLVALWREGSGAWHPSLVSDATGGPVGPEEATLVASVAPPEVQGRGLPRDIVFVVDTSGSMSGGKMTQARESLREVLLTLRPDDRFGIVRFASDVERLTPGLVDADDGNIQTYRERLKDLQAEGSTALDDGLQEGLAQLTETHGERVPLIVLLSDGMPTSGITDGPSIVSRMVAANAAGAAVHVLAIGLDADDTFLEDVAAESGGTLNLLAPDDDLQERLAGFYASLEDPLVTGVQVTIDGVETQDLYPKVMPALYKGSTLLIAFRADLTTAETVSIRLQGVSPAGAVDETFVFNTTAIGALAEADRIWGSMHVAALLAQERTLGTSPELRGEIIEAAKEHGIVTPYTSWIIERPILPEVPGREAGSPPAPTTTPTSAATPAGGLARHGTDPAHQPVDGGTSPDWSGEDAAEDGEETPGPTLGLLLSAFVCVLWMYRRRR